MADPLAELLAGPPPDEERGEGEYESEAEIARKMQEAMDLNAQLKMIVQQHELEQQQMMRMQQRSRQQTAPGPGRSPPRANKGQGGWGGQTHTQTRSTEINRENAILVSKLSNIATRNKLAKAAPFRANPLKSTEAINRRRKDDQIARENAAMAKRLNSVKPTTTLSNKTAVKHAQQHTKYLQVLRPPPSHSSAMAQQNPLYAGPQPPPSRGRSAAAASRARQPIMPQLVPRDRAFQH